MKTVFRYEINNPSGVNDIQMPMGAKILSVGTTLDWEYISDDEADDTKVFKEIINLWALVDTDDIKKTRRFIVAGTGANLEALTNFDLAFIGTVHKSVKNNSINKYAFHVFETNAE